MLKKKLKLDTVMRNVHSLYGTQRRQMSLVAKAIKETLKVKLAAIAQFQYVVGACFYWQF